jgi:hypothetical protein
MKTKSLPVILTLIVLTLSVQANAQTNLLCMNAQPAGNINSGQEDTSFGSEDNTLGFLHFSELGAFHYSVPKESTLVNVMILSEHGDVLASCPLSPGSSASVGISYLDIPSLPAGKYYIKLIADYAVVDTRQIVKLP